MCFRFETRPFCLGRLLHGNPGGVGEAAHQSVQPHQRGQQRPAGQLAGRSRIKTRFGEIILTFNEYKKRVILDVATLRPAKKTAKEPSGYF